MRFVGESNAIENIFASEGEPAFDDHVAAVLQVIEAVGNNFLLHPCEIHRTLMWRLLPPHEVGVYRSYGVSVSDHVAPQSAKVPYLMMAFWQDLVEAVDRSDPGQDWWDYHHRFECIHPFVDGNGRVGRLLLNQLRLLSGQPWLIVQANRKEAYYAAIRRWRERFWEVGS